MKTVKQFETVGVKIDNVGKTRFYFKENDLLRNKFILGIELLNPAAFLVTAGVSPSGNPLINGYAIACGFLVITGLKADGLEFVNRIPLKRLDVLALSQVQKLSIKPAVIDWPKCYIEFTYLAALSLNEEALFAVYADDTEKGTSRILPEVNGYENISLLIDSAIKIKFFFKENDLLRNKKIFGIESFSANTMSYDVLGNAICNNNALANAYLVLVSEKDNKEFVNKVPLVRLDLMAAWGDKFVIEPTIVNWAKSYVEFSDISYNVLNESLMFGFLHE